jgi:hypothetical protein
VPHAIRTVALATLAAAGAVAVMASIRTVEVEVIAGLVLVGALMLLAHTALRLAEDPEARRRRRGSNPRLR